ncbi:MAG: hypothetical protein J5643_10025 [Lachnospiraceae bacterium]|nr:hypothetical protein [Lachnospiraceae bacterium]
MSKRAVSFLFCGILSALGAFFIFLGISNASGAVDNDLLFAHMLLTIPGILGIGSGLLCLLRKHYRSGAAFVILNFIYTLLAGFLIECLYFQFIHFGPQQPQPRLAIPALGITAVFCVVYMIFHIICTCVYSRCKK